jgi:hypothetical protein
VGPVNEVHRTAGNLVVDGLHALLGKRAGVLDCLSTLAVGAAMKHAPGSKALLEVRILGIVGILRLLLGIQVIQIAEELVEPMHCGEELVLVSQMVLAELPGGVAHGFQQFRNGGIFCSNPDVGPRHSHLGQAGANWVLSGDERCAAGGAALLAVVVGAGCAFVADAVNVGRPVTHLAPVVIADVPPADVVPPKDKDVRVACFSHFDLLQFRSVITGALTSHSNCASDHAKRSCNAKKAKLPRPSIPCAVIQLSTARPIATREVPGGGQLIESGSILFPNVPMSWQLHLSAIRLGRG